MDKNILEKTTDLLCFNYYISFFRKMNVRLKLSRLPILKNNGMWLFWLQKKMVLKLSAFQKTIKEGKELLNKEQDVNKQKSIQRRIDTHRYLARSMQTIADGIAWRSLNFNRQLLRLFSENSSPGSIEEEIPTIFNIKRSKKCKVIINDLTRYCRIGDFTIITPNNDIILIEAKKRKEELHLNTIQDIDDRMKKAKRKKRTKQEERQFIAQNAIINNKIKIPIFNNGKLINELEINIKAIDIPLKNHYKKIKKIIRKADKKLSYLEELEKGYLIKIIAYDKIVKKLKDKESEDSLVEKITIKRPEWTKNNPDCIQYNNYLGYEEKNNQFARNLTPFSVLPFSSKDCTRMILGGLHIEIFFDINIIKRKLEDKGWIVKKENWEEEYKKNKIRSGKNKDAMIFFKDKKDYVALSAKKEFDNGTYGTQITITQILQLISTFYNTDTFVDMLEFMSKEFLKTKQEGLVAPNLVNEYKILI